MKSSSIVSFPDPISHTRNGSADIGAGSWFYKFSNRATICIDFCRIDHMIIVCTHHQQITPGRDWTRIVQMGLLVFTNSHRFSVKWYILRTVCNQMTPATPLNPCVLISLPGVKNLQTFVSQTPPLSDTQKSSLQFS